MSLEVRDLSPHKIELVFSKIEQEAEVIERKTGVEISFHEIDIEVEPTLTDPGTQTLLKQTARALGLSYRSLPSGAAHDAQNMARIVPSAMIFVPSVGGISHSPKEHTRARDITNGANLLLHAVLGLDREVRR